MRWAKRRPWAGQIAWSTKITGSGCRDEPRTRRGAGDPDGAGRVAPVSVDAIHDDLAATQRRHADGSTSMRVPTSAMSSVLVTRGAAGNLILTEGQGDVLPTAPQAQQEVMK